MAPILRIVRLYPCARLPKFAVFCFLRAAFDALWFECKLTPGAAGVDDWFVLLLLLANLQCRIYKIYASFCFFFTASNLATRTSATRVNLTLVSFSSRDLPLVP